MFCEFVQTGSPAALAGIRLWDELLEINGENLSGYSSDKAMNVLKEAKGQRISFAVKDRYFLLVSLAQDEKFSNPLHT